MTDTQFFWLVIGVWLLGALVSLAVISYLGHGDDSKMLVVVWPLVLLVAILAAPFVLVSKGARALGRRHGIPDPSSEADSYGGY